MSSSLSIGVQVPKLKRFLARRVLPAILGLLRVLTPRLNHAVLASTPATEDNVIEIARALLARYSGDIVWLDAPGSGFLASVGLNESGRICVIPRRSLRAFWMYVTAELVFYTHGLYGEPAALRKKSTVNLWHGEGPKRMDVLFPARKARSKPSDFIVGQTQFWGTSNARASGLESANILWSGFPRLDAMLRGAKSASLKDVGIDPDRPYVLWMPAYRQAAASGTMYAWSDVTDVTIDNELDHIISRGLRRLEAMGIQIVVKLHPFESKSRKIVGAIDVSGSDLEDAGISLYSLIGGSSGLISDYSSVWVDYLILDRPIAFFWPDYSSYAAGRGIYPIDLEEWLPGKALETESDFVDFGGEVLEQNSAGSSVRARCMQHFGFVDPSPQTHANRLLDLLKARLPEVVAGRIG